MAGAGKGVAEAGANAVVDEMAPLRRRVSVQWPGKAVWVRRAWGGCGDGKIRR